MSRTLYSFKPSSTPMSVVHDLADLSKRLRGAQPMPLSSDAAHKTADNFELVPSLRQLRATGGNW
eukprot:11179938-Lingulodinium_polyedra.AAC.2